MDDGDVAVFAEGDFEVVDECMDEDEGAVVNEIPLSSSSASITKNKNVDETPGSVAKKLKTDASNTSPQKADKDGSTSESNCNDSKHTEQNVDTKGKDGSIQDVENQKDGSASHNKKNLDSSFERMRATGEYMTDEEILNHLDDIENIDLDGSSLAAHNEINETIERDQVSDKDPSETASKVTMLNESENNGEPEMKASIIEEEKMEEKKESETKHSDEDAAASKNENLTDDPNWYEKKLEAKVATVRERLSKLARVLEFSYPRYKDWLDRNEAVTHTPVCQLMPARRCSLDKPYTNRWKFICNRKPVQESTEKQNAESEESTGDGASMVWQLIPTGVWGSNTDNASEYPPFVMKAVKVFEDFLQTTCPHTEESSLKSSNDADIEAKEDVKSDKNSTSNETEDKANAPQQWLWLLVRCNSMDELMLFATGKNIDRSTMDSLKQVYETGAGKDCNVKSLYCKSITKVEGTINTTTTFLVGSEALDEVVGGIKIQLAPKTNFWSNAAGAESLANAVADLLAPTPKTTVVEIGCGTGLIGLMLASKCHQVIGLDSPSEVEEAEMTSELNGVKNASFVMGQPVEVMATIAQVLANCKAAAIVNTNTNIGRAIEVMTYVRKISSLRRLVLVTTLTKQSVRAILELTRPTDNVLGNPFVPIRARVVDTLPIGPHFEVIILMERRLMHKFPHHWIKPSALPSLSKSSPNPTKTPPNPKASPNSKSTNVANLEKAKNANRKAKQAVLKTEKHPAAITTKNQSASGKEPPKKFEKKGKFVPPANKKLLIPPEQKNPKNIPFKNKFKGKRPHSPERPHVPAKKIASRFDKVNFKPWKSGGISPQPRLREEKPPPNRADNFMQRRLNTRHRSPFAMKSAPDKTRHHRSWSEESVMPHHSPIRDKKFRESKDTSDLRERLSGNRIEPEIMEKVKKQQQMLELAKQKLTGPSPNVDIATAKQLQNMLNMVLEQTNKLQSQLPRSVWDRIAPPSENAGPAPGPSPHVDPLLKGRYVQEMGTQDILITTSNREFLKPNEPPARANFGRYDGTPMQRNTLMSSNMRPESGSTGFNNPIPDRYRPNVSYNTQQQQPDNQWNREKPVDKSRWNQFQPMKKPVSPIRKPMSPIRHQIQPGRRLPSPRRNLSPMKRLSSPPRLMAGPPKRHMSPPRRQMSPPRRQMSPLRRLMSPPRRQLSPGRPQILSARRQISPPRRLESPLRRPMSPHRRPMSPSRLRASPTRRQVSPTRRHVSPPRRPGDDWDIPSRGAIEQSTWQRPGERMPEKRWHDERQPTTLANWENPQINDRYRKTVNQDKWDIKDGSHEAIWTNSGSGDTWDPKQSSGPSNKEHWQSNSESRWQNSTGGPNGDNWNIRGKDSGPKSSMRDEMNSTWMDSNKSRWETGASGKESWGQADKDDWNDLPDDAKDPWGDDGTSAMKERWPKYDNAGPSVGGWVREGQQGALWARPNDNWQNKPTTLNKSQWQSSTTNEPVNEIRWSSTNVQKKAPLSGNWSSGNNTNNWQQQNYSGFQQQRSYNTGSFKDRR